MHTVHTMTNTLRLRVHIAPVGFEIDRIIIPAKKMRADRVWLIGHMNRAVQKTSLSVKKVNKRSCQQAGSLTMGTAY